MNNIHCYRLIFLFLFQQKNPSTVEVLEKLDKVLLLVNHWPYNLVLQYLTISSQICCVYYACLILHYHHINELQNVLTPTVSSCYCNSSFVLNQTVDALFYTLEATYFLLVIQSILQYHLMQILWDKQFSF